MVICLGCIRKVTGRLLKIVCADELVLLKNCRYCSVVEAHKNLDLQQLIDIKI